MLEMILVVSSIPIKEIFELLSSVVKSPMEFIFLSDALTTVLKMETPLLIYLLET
jgi:hypothetical protein